MTVVDMGGREKSRDLFGWRGKVGQTTIDMDFLATEDPAGSRAAHVVACNPDGCTQVRVAAKILWTNSF